MEVGGGEIAELIRRKEIENGRLLVERTRIGDVDGVAKLLDDGVQPNADAYVRSLYYDSKNYWSPLHHACYNGYHEIARLLIDYDGMSVCFRLRLNSRLLNCERQGSPLF